MWQHQGCRIGSEIGACLALSAEMSHLDPTHSSVLGIQPQCTLGQNIGAAPPRAGSLISCHSSHYPVMHQKAPESQTHMMLVMFSDVLVKDTEHHEHAAVRDPGTMSITEDQPEKRVRCSISHLTLAT